MTIFEVLPAELIAYILIELDPSSFYICIQTSRHFRAQASKGVLLTQLHRIPGPPVLSEVGNHAGHLLEIFLQRANQHLFNGAEQMADVHTWHASPNIDRKTSCFIKGRCRPPPELTMPNLSTRDSEPLLFLEVQAQYGIVNIYSVLESGLNLDHIITPQMVQQHLPSNDEVARNECTVVKIAARDTCSDDTWTGFPTIAVMYAPRIQPQNSKDDYLVIICFTLDPHYGPMITAYWDASITAYWIASDHIDGPICMQKKNVVAMALCINADPIVVYRYYDEDAVNYAVIIYTKPADQMTGLPLDIKMLIQRISLEEPVGSVVHDFSGGAPIVYLHPVTVPIPYWSTMVRGRHPPRRRHTSIPAQIESFRNMTLGRILATYHHHRVRDNDPNNAVPKCVNTAVELMFARTTVNEPSGANTRQGVFLLKALEFPDECRQLNVNDDRTMSHLPVARLDGLSLDNISSIGVKLAISADARMHRIAIAHWRTVLIYAINPRAFLDPAFAGAPRDDVLVEIERCGRTYYKNAAVEGDCLVLQPVRLECKGVVYGLEWRGEKELWGWTDQGLVRWRVGSSAQGRRTSSKLDEAVSETHIEAEESESDGEEDMGDSEVRSDSRSRTTQQAPATKGKRKWARWKRLIVEGC